MLSPYIAKVLHGWLYVQIPVPQEGHWLHLCSLQAVSYGNNWGSTIAQVPVFMMLFEVLW